MNATKRINEKSSAGAFFRDAFIIAAIVIVLALLIESCIESNFPNIDKLDAELASGTTDILYFGASDIEGHAPEDIDTRTMVEMLREDTGRKVTSIAHPAYHTGVFEAYSDYVCQSPGKPKLVIAPINLRSFSPEWDLRPGYQFSDEIAALTGDEGNVLLRLWTRISRLLSSGESFTLAEWKKQPVYFGSSQRGIVKDYVTGEDPVETEAIMSKYIFHYGAYLDPHHRRLESLRLMLENYRDCGVPVILYITPIDHELGVHYVGEEFNIIVDKNIATVMAVGDEYEVLVLDLAYDVGSNGFDHPNTPNEHLRDSGRRYVIEQIAQAIEY